MRSKYSKRGQTGSSAAIMMIIIMVVIILYILFLPPDERAALLGDDENATGSSNRTTILLKESRIEMVYLKGDLKDYDMQAFSIGTETSGQVIRSKSSIYIKNSLFEKLDEKMDFVIDPGLSENLVLSFNTEVAEGRLTITVNDDVIYSGVLKKGSSPPIYIDKDILDQKNIMTFSVSGPGIAFWRYNQYSLKDIKITADVTDISQSEAKSTVKLEQRDIDNIEDSKFRYLPVCSEPDTLNFEIWFNDDLLFKGVPDCTVYNYLPIGKESMKDGTNTFTFKIEKGEVLVDRPRLTLTLAEPEYPVYYFDIDPDNFNTRKLGSDYEYYLSSKYNVTLELTFPDDDQKKMEIFINGRKTSINIAKKSYSRDISTYVQPDTNSLEIRPLNDFTINEMRVKLRKK